MYYIGVDIQIRRDCSYAVIDTDATLVDSGWFSSAETDAVDLVKRWSKSGQVYVGIDAPRMPVNFKTPVVLDRKQPPME